MKSNNQKMNITDLREIAIYTQKFDGSGNEYVEFYLKGNNVAFRLDVSYEIFKKKVDEKRRWKR